MGPEERLRVVESLPGEVTWDEMAMPEGDPHFGAKVRTLDVLKGHFRHEKRKVYLGAELPVYYPAERRFAPDLVAVLDAEPHERDKWVVSHEGKGLDWVLEVHYGGDRKKDAIFNVTRYAQLGIPEYFIYDRRKQRLEGYRLSSPEARKYDRMLPRQGRFVSQMLGLELEVSEEKLQLWAGNALLLESTEMLARFQEKLEQVALQREEEARHREEMENRLVEETRRREDTEQRLKDLQAELERLQRPK
jgi:Uma2 family endonuclease